MKIGKITHASRIFLDTAPLIYWVEDHPLFAPLLEPIFVLISDGKKLGISSTITLLEVLVKPFQMNRTDLVSKYKSILLNDFNFVLGNVDPEVCELAASLKAKYVLKTPDAIQLAVAHFQKSDLFVTNDHRLGKVRELPVFVLSEHLG